LDVAGYAIYYGTNRGVYPMRFDCGTNTMATFSSLTVGTTYYFSLVAYNDANVESLPSAEIAYTVPTTFSPVLMPISDQTISVGQTLNLTNSIVADPDVSTNLTYSLVTSPDGMLIDPATGFLTWTPSASQAGTTNPVTILVSDDSTPPLTGTQNFVVNVSDLVQINLGSATVGMGMNGSVSLWTFSSSPITNLTFALDVPSDWITNVTVQSLFPQNVVVTQNPPGAANSIVTVQTTDGSPLPNGQPILQINFSSIPNQPLASAPIQVSAINAALADGETPGATNTTSSITFVNPNSYLTLQMANGQPSLTLCGPPGNYQILSTTDLASGAWTNEASIVLTNTSQIIPNVVTDGVTSKFFRTKILQ
jgi:hypothetical protein